MYNSLYIYEWIYNSLWILYITQKNAVLNSFVSIFPSSVNAARGARHEAATSREAVGVTLDVCRRDLAQIFCDVLVMRCSCKKVILCKYLNDMEICCNMLSLYHQPLYGYNMLKWPLQSSRKNLKLTPGSTKMTKWEISAFFMSLYEFQRPCSKLPEGI